MKHLLRILTCLTCIAATSWSASAFQVYSYEVKGRVGRPVEVKVVNSYEVPVIVRVVAEPETVKTVPENARDCSTTLRSFPRVFSLEPGQMQIVKFLSRSEGYCRIYFVVDRNEPETIQTDSVVLRLRLRIGIPAEFSK